MARKTRTIDSFSNNPRPQYNQNEMNRGLKIPAGIYRGIVVDVEDPAREGRIKVQIMKFYGTHPIGESTDPNTLDPEKYIGSMWCRTMLPMGGTTAEPGAETSYGFVGQPPDINNEVIVAFGGDTHSGIVLGVVLDPGRNDTATGAAPRGQSSDGKNTLVYSAPSTGIPQDLPNEHPQAKALEKQGLQFDLIRGLPSSSPRRDSIPRVTGMTTPAGHSLVLDDGQGEDGDDLAVRLRSAGGAQILMDDTNGLTYVNNRDGTVWLEMNRNGDIDVYAAGSINMHTPGSFNLHSGADFNLNAVGNINMRGANIGMESLGDFNALSAGNMNLTSKGNGNLNMSGNLRVTAGRIDLNGPAADTATVATPGQLSGNTGVTESVSSRVPEAEPWSGHLDVANQIPSGGSVAGGRAQDSRSHYYGQPSDSRTYNEQTGEWAEREALATGGDYLNIQPGVDMRVEQKLVTITNEAARQVGIPLTIVDGFRETAGRGAKNSQHLYGRAFDISRSGLDNADRIALCEAASTLGITGIGIYSGGSLHWDIRPGQRVVWGDDWTSGSVPAYAREFARRHRAGAYFDPNALKESLGGEDFDAEDFNAGELTPESTSPGMTPDRAKAIKKLSNRYGMSSEALAGILDIESGIDPNIRGGASNRYYGIFQLQDTQIPGLTQQALGQRLTPAQYRTLGFNDQLRVYEAYINNAGVTPGSGFFTGQPGPDASRLWALQLAPSNAMRIDYSNPNAVISRTNQASAISARRGLVTVGSVQSETVRRGGGL